MVPQALLHYFDKATGRKSRKPPQFAKKGQKIVALIECAQPICIERFVDHPQLGRFTLRDEGRTVAIGKVRDPRFSRFTCVPCLITQYRTVIGH